MPHIYTDINGRPLKCGERVLVDGHKAQFIIVEMMYSLFGGEYVRAVPAVLRWKQYDEDSAIRVSTCNVTKMVTI